MFVPRSLWWILKTVFGRRGSGRNRFQPGKPFPVRVVRIQDGDSLLVRPLSRNGDELRLRLYGIDAPERDQEFGREARDRLNSLVREKTDLILEPMDTDRYGRLVGVLYFRASGRGRSVNRLLVQEGLARWYSQYGGQELGLEQAEREARRARRGIWASGKQVAPWDHRQVQRREPARGSLLRTLLVATLISVVVLVSVYVLPHLF